MRKGITIVILLFINNLLCVKTIIPFALVFWCFVFSIQQAAHMYGITMIYMFCFKPVT